MRITSQILLLLAFLIFALLAWLNRGGPDSVVFYMEVAAAIVLGSVLLLSIILTKKSAERGSIDNNKGKQKIINDPSSKE